MFYYETGNLGNHTNNEKLAKLKVDRGEWASYESTEEEIVMQGDGSGLVLASNYVEDLTITKENKIKELKEIRDEKEGKTLGSANLVVRPVGIVQNITISGIKTPRQFPLETQWKSRNDI